MRSEVESDIAGQTLYFGRYLSPDGCDAFPGLLLEAADSHDDDWLAHALGQPGFHLTEYEKRKPSGGFTMASVPYTAANTLAEGEFNRFYVRGLCMRAIEDGSADMRVLRVKNVEKPRAISEQLCGSLLDSAALLADLRAHKGLDTALGLPPGPNSGLSVELA